MNSATAPEVSIVLPTFNGERFLALSIESVLAQTFENWELIVVDDCSTDGTHALAEGFASRDERIQVLRNAENSRIPRSLNRGFAETRGRFLTWTSDDNLFLPQALEQMVGALADADMVYADQGLVNDSGERIGTFSVKEPSQMLDSNPVNACFLYRREVHDALGGYDENLFLAEDWDFWLRASLQFRLRTLHEELYLYRKHGGSLTEQRRLDCLRAFLKMVEKNWDAIGRCPQLAVDALISSSNALRAIGDGAESKRKVLQALKVSPFYTLRRHSKRVVANLMRG